MRLTTMVLVHERKGHLAGTIAAVLALCPGLLSAQRVGELKGFKVGDPHDPPHQSQMRWLLEGATAQPQPGGRALLTDAKLQTFRETGEGQMVVETPQCFYDSGRQTVSSPGPLRLQTADGKFSIEGLGFLWQQTDASLIISNSVHTTVQAALLGAQSSVPSTNTSAPAANDIEIFSDQFLYSTNTGLGVYRGNVRVAGTNLSLTSAVLTVLVPVTETQKPPVLQTITAEQDVQLDFAGIHATGGRASYAVGTGLAQLAGHPTWRAEHREGRGEELIIDPTNKILRANGQAYLKMLGQALSTAGFFAGQATAANSFSATNQFVEIQSDSYELRTNSALFEKEVQAQERADEQLHGEINCERMRITFSDTNELQSMIAENHVVIEQADQRLTGGKAVYNADNGLLEVTEGPAWKAGQREGRGDRLLVNVQREEMIVRGNASMRLPAEQLGQPVVTPSGLSSPADTTTRTNRFAEIFSQEYSLKSGTAQFREKVRLQHPRMEWTCERLSAQLPPEDRGASSMLAERAVVFDLTDDKGQQIHGRCEQAHYTYNRTATWTNDIVELTGDPILETTNGKVQNRVIILDRVNHSLVAPGEYKITSVAEAGGTNTFPLRLK